jgi:hypothetical protein
MASWYVDNAATGTNAGTSWENAWESFGDIVWGGAGVVAGDTLYVSGGSTTKTYSERMVVGASGSAGYPITISVGQDASHNGVATFTLTADEYGGISITGRSYITLQGNYGSSQHMRFTGCKHCGLYIGASCHHLIFDYLESDTNGDGSNLFSDDGIYFDMGVSEPDVLIAEIRNCKIHDNNSRGILINGPTNTGTMYGRFLIHDNDIYNLNDDAIFSTSGGMDIYDNDIHGIVGVKGHPDGMQLLNGYDRVWGNYVYDIGTALWTPNSYIFIDLNKGDTDCGNILVYNNICKHNQGPIAGDDYVRGIAYKMEATQSGCDNVLIANNTVIGMPAWGIEGDFRAAQVTNVRVLNNLLYNNGQLAGCDALVLECTAPNAIGSDGDAVDIIMDYNLVNEGPSGNNDWTPTVDTQDHGLTGDPLLDSEFAPQIGSPAIAAAKVLSSDFTTDKDGVERGASWDMGAYEYGAPVLQKMRIY